MTLTIAVLSDHGAWGIALIIGLLAALAVTALLVMLIRAVDDIDRSASSLLDVAGKVGANTANIHSPQYDFNDDVLPIGASYWVTLAEQQLAARGA